MDLKLKKIQSACFSIATIALGTTDKKNPLKGATGIAMNEATIFITILLFLTSFFLQAQNDSIKNNTPLFELSLLNN